VKRSSGYEGVFQQRLFVYPSTTHQRLEEESLSFG